ncbi:3-hydroxyacyl-CoA dehydrogenase, partial [Baffinella frigidus]
MSAWEKSEVCKPDCIIATNTSGIPVRKIAEFAQRPENIVGMHYFSPVTAMPLVEIIPHAGTSEEVTATAVAVALKQGKFPVVVKDVAGFFVNRCLGPYIDESM